MICIPIVAENIEEAKKDIAKAVKLADIIEIRLDKVRDVNEKNIKELLYNRNKPIIVTDRKNRMNLLKEAVKLGVDFVDIEFNNQNIIKKLKKTKTIISYHDFKGTNGIEEIYEKIKDKGDIVKIVTFANSINDNLKIFNLIKRAKQERKKIISFCMGENGEISRILCLKFGAMLTFASLKKGKESAPGQLTAEELKNTFNIDKLDDKTNIFGVVGNPVKHSLSPNIHNKVFRELGLNNIYLRFSAEFIGSFIKLVKNMDVKGLSVTIPHKISIIKYLDELDPLAKKIGAVNTVSNKNGKLIGYNTDCVGAVKALEDKTNIKSKKVVILGAGGAARAIAFGLKEKKCKIIILNRTVEKAKKIADELRCEFRSLKDLKNIDYDVLINATSVGMWPKVNETVVDKNLLKGVVMDCIYNPVKTRLLKEAEENGCKIISGVEMFVNQAAEQFRIWTGKKKKSSKRVNEKSSFRGIKMRLVVSKSKLEGEIEIPPSKSHTIRAVVIGSLAKGSSKIINPLDSDDTNSAVNACRALGAKIEKGKDWVVKGFNGKPKMPKEVINVGNSGTTLRLMTSVAALGDFEVKLDGDSSIRKRPIKPLLDALNNLGVKVRGGFPITVKGPIKGGETEVEGITSQYLSSLLISCPLAGNDTKITVNNLHEIPYVEMTLRWLDKQGIKFENKDMKEFEIKGKQSYKGFKGRIPGDFSSATFPLCAAAITNGDVLLKGLDMNDVQGDKEIINMLKKMGANITINEEGIRVQGGELEGIELDLNNTPDALPALAVVGCVAKGTTILKNVEQARIKETDRIKAMKLELSKMGADIKERKDGLIIKQSKLKGTKLDGHNDHRVVMALSIAGLIAEGVTEIGSAESVNITFPNYVGLMNKIKADIKKV